MKMRNLLGLLFIFGCMCLCNSCNSRLNDGEYNLELYAQSDIHGRYFDSLYVEDAEKLSVANVSEYLNLRRDLLGKEDIIAIDNGDHLQGDIAAYYYNYVYDYTTAENKNHLFAQICDFVDFDAVVSVL